MERYRIELTKIGDERDETLVALEGSVELVERLAGTLISGALDDADGEDEPRNATAAEVVNATLGRTKRKRRTKAEIAADKLAAEQAAAGGPVSPLPAGVESPLAEPLPPAESAAVGTTPPEPAAAPATAATPASDAPAVPYDPFAAK